MRADKDGFINLISGYDREQLIALAVSLYDEASQLRLIHSENSRINTEVHIQFSALKEKADALSIENQELKVLLAKEIDKNTLKNKSTFGRSTEKFLPLIDAADNRTDEPEDESDIVDASTTTEKSARLIDFPGKKQEDNKGKIGIKKTKKKGLVTSAKNLPKELVYDIDPSELDRLYGQNGWRIAYWHPHRTVEVIPLKYYVREVYTPVISVGLEHDLVTMPYENLLINRSMVSASIAADIIYRKFVLGLPFYRQATDFSMNGLELSKQTIINWVNKLVPNVFEGVYDYLIQRLLECGYIQNDETYIQINKDGCAPGHKSYIWVHTGSELLDCAPIIVFCYEATRNTEHLRAFFGEFMGYITCDAYISYHVLEAESDGRITATGCLMHCRRYFAEAFFVNDVASLPNDELLALKETKALMLIRDIYTEENRLKEMSADGRKVARSTDVAPKVEAFFKYVHSLRESNEILSDRMNKAVTYAINQEQYLRRFLDDGHIPIDNGNCERIIRSYSIGRANWLFADTIAGAKVNAIAYSIVETAKANRVNVGCYLNYLFEKLPAANNPTDKEFLASMMPWSTAYKEYEAARKQAEIGHYRNIFPEPERPRTPTKREPIRHLPLTKDVPSLSNDMSA
jgi:hypothetical protein